MAGEQQQASQRFQPTPQCPDEAGGGGRQRRLGLGGAVRHRKLNRVDREQLTVWTGAGKQAYM